MIDDLRRRSAAEVFEDHLRLAGEHRFEEVCEGDPRRKYSKTTCASLASIALRRTYSGTFRPTSLSSNVEVFSEA
jgi:hypothetical protein